MSVAGEVLVGFVIAIGLLGVILPILPGVVLIFAAIGVWALIEGTASAWTVFAVCTALLVVTGIVKFTWPGRRMRTAGVPRRSLFLGALLGVIGFFVIPVLGLFIGFVAGVYASETQRLRGHSRAWASTVHAVKAVGLSMLVELLGALLASGIWLVAVLV